MIRKEIRCKNNRDNKVCNQKLFEYEGELNNVIIFGYCRKCKKVAKVVNGILEIKKINIIFAEFELFKSHKFDEWLQLGFKN